MMRLILVIALLASTQGIFAQSEAQILMDKVTQYYRGLENMELKMDYLIFNSHETQKITERAKGHFIKKGADQYLKQYGTTMIAVDNELLIKDDSTNMIVLSKMLPRNQEQFNQLMTTLDAYYQVKELTMSNGNRRLLLTMDAQKPSDIDKIEMEVNENTLQIKNMTFYYRKKYDVSDDPRKPIFKQPKMKLVYTYFNPDPSIKKDQFNLAKYIATDQTGKKTLTAQYNSYEFIYQ